MKMPPYQCPEHGNALIKKSVVYGYPIPGKDYSKCILGGCCVSEDSPKHGYECPVDKMVFYLKDGRLTEEV